MPKGCKQAIVRFRWADCNSAPAFSQTVFPAKFAPPTPCLKFIKKNSFQLFACGNLLFISPFHQTATPPLLGNSSTVERRTLTPLILVRIQVPQPKHCFNSTIYADLVSVGNAPRIEPPQGRF
jgi:hypothetical protein